MQPDGVYLFCFAGPGARAEGVSVAQCGGCCAVTEAVAVEEFSAEHLADLEWLAPRACRHAQVIEEVMRTTAVLPARFGTIFSSPAELARFAEAHQAEICAFLERVAGREEWSVKVFADEPGGREEHLAGADAGTRYLMRKKRRAAERIEAEAESPVSELAELACATAARRMVAAPGQRILRHDAFLVDQARAADFRAHVDAIAARCAPQGLRLALSGPWPPYSFVPELAGA